jgi:hypothetical protein
MLPLFEALASSDDDVHLHAGPGRTRCASPLTPGQQTIATQSPMR